MDIARSAGMGRAMYCHIENGGRDITVNRLGDISEALGVKPATLISRAYKLQFTHNESVAVDVID